MESDRGSWSQIITILKNKLGGESVTCLRLEHDPFVLLWEQHPRWKDDVLFSQVKESTVLSPCYL